MANPLLIGAAIDAGKALLNRLIPDKAAAAAAQLEFEREMIAHDARQNEAQTEVNKAEAANPNLFVSGWRPFIGWVCGTAVAFQFVVAPLATWIAALEGTPVAFPSLDMGTLLTLLLGMLGLGGMRSWEKAKGVAAR